MTEAERSMLLFLGAVVANEFDESRSVITEELRTLAIRVAAETRAANGIAAMDFNRAEFWAAVETFYTTWGDMATHDSNAKALFREIGIILLRRPATKPL